MLIHLPVGEKQRAELWLLPPWTRETSWGQELLCLGSGQDPTSPPRASCTAGGALGSHTDRTREKAFTAEAYPPHLAFFLLMIHLGDGRPDLSEQT